MGEELCDDPGIGPAWGRVEDKGGRLVDLGLNLHLRGRAAKPLYAEVVRPLRESDLAMLTIERGTKPSALKKISNRHHALARLLATGVNATEASLVTGITPSRISVLKGDPAFQELMSHYTDLKAEQVADLQERLTTTALVAIDIIQDRLEEEPETFDNPELRELVKLTADRTGHGPKSTNVNVNVNLGDRLANARKRVSAGTDSGETPAAQVPGPSLQPLLIEGQVLKGGRNGP